MLGHILLKGASVLVLAVFIFVSPANAEQNAFGLDCKLTPAVSSCSIPTNFLNCPQSGGHSCPSSFQVDIPPGKLCRFRGTYTPLKIIGEIPASSQTLNTSAPSECNYIDTVAINGCAPRNVNLHCGATKPGSSVSFSSTGPGSMNLNYCCTDPGDHDLCAGLQNELCARSTCSNDYCPGVDLTPENPKIRWLARNIDEYDEVDKVYTAEPGLSHGGVLWPIVHAHGNREPDYWNDSTGEFRVCFFNFRIKNHGLVQGRTPPSVIITKLPGTRCDNLGLPEHDFIHDSNVKTGQCGNVTSRADAAIINLGGSCGAKTARFACTFKQKENWSAAPSSICPGWNMVDMHILNQDWDSEGLQIEYTGDDWDGVQLNVSVCCGNPDDPESVKCNKTRQSHLVKSKS